MILYSYCTRTVAEIRVIAPDTTCLANHDNAAVTTHGPQCLLSPRANSEEIEFRGDRMVVLQGHVRLRARCMTGWSYFRMHATVAWVSASRIKPSDGTGYGAVLVSVGPLGATSPPRARLHSSLCHRERAVSLARQQCWWESRGDGPLQNKINVKGYAR
jgi:hypothetical protein